MAIDLEAETPHSSRTPQRRAYRWYLAAGSVVAAAAVVLLAIRLNRPSSELYVPEMAELVAAAGTWRPVEPRLTGGFSYGPAQVVTRGNTGDPPLSVMSAAARLERKAEGNSPDAQAAFGVAQVLLGQAAAVTSLEKACRARPADARCKSDLAAAYLVAATNQGDREAAGRALEAAQAAVQLDRQLREAWFNRALAFEALDRSGDARTAWDDYLRMDSTSPWATEARSRQARLSDSPR